MGERTCTAVRPCPDRVALADTGDAYIEAYDDGTWWLAGENGRPIAAVTHCPWCGGELVDVAPIRIVCAHHPGTALVDGRCSTCDNGQAVYEAGYRQGWRNGRHDRDMGEDDIGEDPGDSYAIWLDESAGIPFGAVEEQDVDVNGRPLAEDDEGLGVPCEGCKSPAVTRDSDGIPLCGDCYDALPFVDEVPRG